MFVATRLPFLRLKHRLLGFLLARSYRPKPLLAAGKAKSTNSDKKFLKNGLIPQLGQIFRIGDRPGPTRTEMSGRHPDKTAIFGIRPPPGMTGVLDGALHAGVTDDLCLMKSHQRCDSDVAVTLVTLPVTDAEQPLSILVTNRFSPKEKGKDSFARVVIGREPGLKQVT